MSKKSSFKKLQQLGYSRTEDYLPLIQRETVLLPSETMREADFKGKSLNHTILERVTLQKCDFSEACVTGSIFRSCKFIDCVLDQADFEFCEFYNCEFQLKLPVGCSFNNSSFIESVFEGTQFKSCTFTNTFFQKCEFSGVQIDYSTLEGALFRQCGFYSVDFRHLNMDYIELESPYMKNVVLPLDQIPFIFGAMQYLKSTNDAVYVSKGAHGRMTAQDFFEEVIPLLCNHFIKSKQFFPLANIHYALGQSDEALKATKEGLISSMSIRDFRMLKYYCKLIAYSGAFRPNVLHNLYNNYICRLYPQTGLKMPNYSRHILEIKDLLFSATKSAAFRMSLRTNVSLQENEKLGKLFESIFSIGKWQGFFQGSDIQAVLQQNSPLVVTISVSGDEKQLVALLAAYLLLAGITVDEQRMLPIVSQYRTCTNPKSGPPKRNPAISRHFEQLEALAVTRRKELQAYSVQMVMMEYYAENFNMYSNHGDALYYFNGEVVSGQTELPIYSGVD